MGRAAKWNRLILAVGSLALCGWTCGTDFRDALIGGAFDFVSGTATDVLSQLYPIANLFPVAGG
jgi:hypothetical protein